MGVYLHVVEQPIVINLKFLQARRPGIYKEHYLKELAARYNGGVMSDIPIPERPGWCLEEEGDTPTENEVHGKVKGKGRKRYVEFQNEV